MLTNPTDGNSIGSIPIYFSWIIDNSLNSEVFRLIIEVSNISRLHGCLLQLDKCTIYIIGVTLAWRIMNTVDSIVFNSGWHLYVTRTSLNGNEQAELKLSKNTTTILVFQL